MFVVFLILKLTGHIDWPWFFVCLPVILDGIFTLLALARYSVEEAKIPGESDYVFRYVFGYLEGSREKGMISVTEDDGEILRGKTVECNNSRTTWAMKKDVAILSPGGIIDVGDYVIPVVSKTENLLEVVCKQSFGNYMLENLQTVHESFLIKYPGR